MALVYADRVQETSTTTGTGTYSLAGAVTGFQTFVAGVGNGNTCYYCAENGTDWEVGLGTVTDAAPDTLARTTVLASSNAGAAVNWAAGTRNLFVTLPGSLVATAAEMEAATAEGKFVTPALQHRHPGHPKCWLRAAGAGTLTESYNITSVTDTGMGVLDVTIATDFSTATWAAIAMVASGVDSAGATNDFEQAFVVAVAAGTVTIECHSMATADEANWSFTAQDPSISYSFVGFGDHA